MYIQAFLPAGPNEVKVVIATNAAESSITLPDVDMVICLGTHKVRIVFIVYMLPYITIIYSMCSL